MDKNMTSFLYTSPEILNLIKKAQQLPKGWDSNTLQNYNKLLESVSYNKIKDLYGLPLQGEEKSRDNRLKNINSILKELTDFAKKEFDQREISLKVDELYNVYKSEIYPLLQYYNKLNPQSVANLIPLSQTFMQAINGFKSLVGQLESLSLSDTYSNSLNEISNMLYSKYQEIDSTRDVLGAIKGLFTGNMTDKEKNKAYISSLRSILLSLEEAVNANNFNQIKPRVDRVNDFINKNKTVFDTKFLDKLSTILNKLNLDSKRMSDEHSVSKDNLKKVSEILLNKVTEEAMAQSVPKTNVTGNAGPKFTDIDDAFHYIEYLFKNSFKVNGKPIVLGDKENGYTLIQINKIGYYFNKELLSESLRDLQRQADLSKDKLFIDLVGNLVEDCKELFTIEVKPDDTNMFNAIDSLQNPLYLDKDTNGNFRLTVDNLKDKPSFDKWLESLYVKLPDFEQPQRPNQDKSLYCKVLNYLLHRATKLNNPQYKKLVSNLMNETSCPLDNDYYKSDSQKDKSSGEQGSGNESQKSDGDQSGSDKSSGQGLSPRDVAEVVQKTNAIISNFPFRNQIINLKLFSDFSEACTQNAVYLINKHRDNERIRSMYQRIGQNSNELSRYISNFENIYSLQNISIPNGAVLKNVVLSQLENYKTSNVCLKNLKDIINKTIGLILFVVEISGGENNPSIMNVYNKQNQFYQQQLRCIDDGLKYLEQSSKNESRY